MTRALTTLMMLGLFAVPTIAQEKPQDTPAQPPARPTAPVAEPQFVNIQVDVTITEHIGKAQPTIKTVSAVALNESGTRIRSGTHRIELNVDVSPKLRAQGQIVLGLTVQYSPRGGTGVEGGGAGDERGIIPSLNQSLTILLQDGKPLIVSQSADPSGDRRVTLEVKATVLR